MPRNKGNHDIASNVRGAFLRACKSLEAKGKPLSTIIEDMLTERPKDALDTVAKFVPKEMLVETTIVQELDSMSDEAIAHEIARLAKQSAAIGLTERAGDQTEH